jgi:curli biogenesis system outer membrane secretion channel CsgG
MACTCLCARGVGWGLAVALFGPATALAQDSRATVAIMYFTNSALIKHDDYEPLSKGITEMLITELAASPAIQVVERDRLQKLLEEQDLNAAGKVDKETAVQLGKILGARHMLMGGFVIDPRQNMRLDLRAVDVETSRVEYVETVSGKAENVLGLISTLGAKVNSRLRLPPLPTARHTGAKTSKSNQLRAVMLLSRALNEEDRGNTSGAMTLYREALGIYPEYDRARVLLASLENPAKPREQ